MDLNQVIIQHRTICVNATAFKLYDALEQSRLFLKGIPIAELKTELETIEETYSNLLSYSMKGINDPQRNMILNSLVVKIVELADKIKEYYLEKNNATCNISNIMPSTNWLWYKRSSPKRLKTLSIKTT